MDTSSGEIPGHGSPADIELTNTKTSQIEIDVRTSHDSDTASHSTPSIQSADEDALEYNNTVKKMLDRLIRSLFHKHELHQVLERPHIAAIAFSGTVGMGIFVTSGELVGISGSVGCVVAYIGAGLIIIPVMRSLAELASVRPVGGGLMDYPETFVDEALGFAVGVTYLLCQCVCMAVLTSAAARAAKSFWGVDGLDNDGLIGIIIGFCMITLFSNLCGVRIYANIERVVLWLKLLLLILVAILMILVKAGVGEIQHNADPNHSIRSILPRHEDGYGNNSIVPFLRWNGFKGPEDLVGGGYQTGISDRWGQFLAIWTTITLAMFSCMGGDIVIVTASESKHPRRDLPPVARFMYLVPIGFYIIISILVGLNINFMNAKLYHPWEKPDSTLSILSHSPIIISLQQTSIKVLPKFLNACFMISAYTAGNTCLYTSSRTLFSFSHTYGNKWMRNNFGTTNDGNTPVAAILLCSTASLLSLLGLTDTSFNQPILSLAAFYTGGVCCVYASECVAYIRFFSGFKYLAAEVLDRGADEYTKQHYYYRAHWQPYCAYFGLFGCTMMVIFSGWPAIYLLNVRDSLSTAADLKSSGLLVADVIGAYSGPVIFLLLFLGYKVIYGTRFQHFRDFEHKYFLAQFNENELPKKRGWMRELLSFFFVMSDCGCPREDEVPAT